jgi:hypothetical protein
MEFIDELNLVMENCMAPPLWEGTLT